MTMYRLTLVCLLIIALWACSDGTTSGAVGNEVQGDSINTDSTVEETTGEAVPSNDTMVAASPARQSGFTQELTADDGIRFVISSPNQETGNTLTISSDGLSNRNQTFTKDLGAFQVERAELADLNQDGFPEVYIFARTNGKDGKAEVYAYASYRNRSYGEIYVAGVPAQDSRMDNYQGGDQFELEKTALVRKFPASANGRASEDVRTLTYKLKMGETSYRLEVE